MLERSFTATAVLLVAASIVVAAEPPASLLKKEAGARRKVAAEMLRLAKFCVANGATSQARDALRAGLEVSPDAANLKEQLAKLEGVPDKPKSGFAKKYRKERESAHLKCAKFLADAALAFERKGFTDRFDGHARLVRARFHSPEAMKHFGLVWFEPYRQWVRKADAKRLSDGWERIEGTWRKPEEVAKLDAEHATWEKPWVLDDGYHELRTNIPIRDARRILHYVTAFREFFLAKFEGEWDLRAPKGRLPIILTRTQAEFQSQVKKLTRGAERGSDTGAAYYYWSNRPLNPCFVTFEPVDLTGRISTVSFEEVLLPLRHELTHQLAFECSKYDCNRSRQPTANIWALEALASYMQNYVLEPDGWRLSRVRTRPMGEGVMNGDFAYCVKNLADLPSLATLMATTPRTFASETNYHMAATVAYFLLDGADRRHRKSFLSLLDRIHKVRANAGSFAECFPGVEMPKLQSEWEAFVYTIQLENS